MAPEEMAEMGRHWEQIQRLQGQGVVHFVGRALNGDYGLCVFDAEDEAKAQGIAESDPAVAEGLLRVEVHAFAVVIDRAA
jgi:uncharacterized protein YciI